MGAALAVCQLPLFDDGAPHQPRLLPLKSVEPDRGPKGGWFITIEGGEGAGKSTQARILEKNLIAAQFRVVVVREPGVTPLGEYVRNWVKRESRTTVMAETLLFEAARAELVRRIIRPALSRGTVVICDRFADSSIAYQGFGRGMRIRTIEQLNEIASGGLVPNLTVLLAVPHDDGLARVNNRSSLLDTDDLLPTRIDPEESRRFESASSDFHARVHEGFATLAEQDPIRWRIVDGTQSKEQIATEVWNIVKSKLEMTFPLPIESAIA